MEILMLGAIGRIKSENRIEKLHGVLFYAAVATLLGLVGYYLYALFYNVEVINNFTLFMGFGAFCLCSIISGNADYKNPKKIHKGTLEHYLADLSPSRGGIIEYSLSDSTVFKNFIFFSLMGIFFVSIGVGIFNLVNGHYLQGLLVSANCLYIVMLMFLSGGFINSIAVSSDKLDAIDSIENISEEDKLKFRHGAMVKIKKDGYISRSEVLSLCKDIKVSVIEQKEIEKKAKVKNNYNDFIEETEKRVKEHNSKI